MAQEPHDVDATVVIDRHGLAALIATLRRQGYDVIGPQVAEEAIVYEPLEAEDELPVGWTDEQDGGRYRLVKGNTEAMFDYVVGPHSWKRYLFPPIQKLWEARRSARGYDFTVDDDTPRYAFIGVRACEIAAMKIQDRVFDNGKFADRGYLDRRAAAFILAVNCGRAGGTCFCVSMHTGPKATGGYDLALTEIVEPEAHRFVVEAGSRRGADVLSAVPSRPAKPADIAAAEARVAQAAENMGREMVPDVAAVLRRNLEHDRWDEVASRCLRCTNCTMVCPTCFCSTTEDDTALDGQTASRWRKQDSCFTASFSYIHGGSVRQDGSTRYRQWMTHKLSHWYEQFGTSGCVGCGRCITWCPVGIDITEEALAIKESERA